MPFYVFDSETGDDVPTFPEQILGKRWSELSCCGVVRYWMLVVSLSVLSVGMLLVLSIMFVLPPSFVLANEEQGSIVVASRRPTICRDVRCRRAAAIATGV